MSDEAPARQRCNTCGGVWHPSCGDWDERFQVARCGRCYREWLKFYKGHMKRKWGGEDFYAHAETSIGAERPAPGAGAR